jgi:glutamate formiminotransferase/formiminotetrahydrofolate cyclodeaminase
MGVDLKARSLAQVSMNLTDFETTPIGTVFDAVSKEASAQGIHVAGSEIVGLIPRRALEDAAVHYLKVENYHSDLIVENRLARVLSEQVKSTAGAPSQLLSEMARGFVDALAADTPTPGGGSASALAGAMAAALAEMVCGITMKKKSLAAIYPAVQDARDKLAELRARLMKAADRDSASYESVMAAFKLPKSTEAEQTSRRAAIESASKKAAEVPLETAQLAVEVSRLAESIQPITAPQAASDLIVAHHLASTAIDGALANVRANLPSIHDSHWVQDIETQIQTLTAGR